MPWRNRLVLLCTYSVLDLFRNCTPVNTQLQQVFRRTFVVPDDLIARDDL